MLEQIKQLTLQCQKNAAVSGSNASNRLSAITSRHTENTLENTLSRLLREFPKAAVIS